MGDDRRILDESQHNPCIPFSSHVVFRNASSREGGDWVGVGGWGRGLLFFITVKNKILIIVDMVLTWKILWFQRVSEHVLELGHYKIKESKVCITHFDCLEIKKKSIFCTFYHSVFSWKYICAVSFLLTTLFRCSVHWRHILLCVC